MKSFVLRSHWPAECAAPYGDPAPHTSPPSIEPSVLEYSLAFEPPTQQQPSVSITRRSGLIALHVKSNIRRSEVRGGWLHLWVRTWRRCRRDPRAHALPLKGRLCAQQTLLRNSAVEPFHMGSRSTRSNSQCSFPMPLSKMEGWLRWVLIIAFHVRRVRLVQAGCAQFSGRLDETKKPASSAAA